MRILPLGLLLALPLHAQTLPLRQSHLDASARDPGFKLALDSTVDARWLGGGAYPATAPGSNR
jgi:hypothetical protein